MSGNRTKSDWQCDCCRLLLNGLTNYLEIGRWTEVVLLESVFSSSGRCGWDTLFYCGTPWSTVLF